MKGLLLLAFSMLMALHSPADEKGSQPIRDTGAETNLFSWINEVRTLEGSPTVARDEVLDQTAWSHAQRLSSLGKLFHLDPEKGNALERYRRHGGTAWRVGEILGAGARLPGIRAGWLESQGHRRVIVQAYWTLVGVGVVETDRTRIAVVIFADRRTSRVEVRIEEGVVRVTGWMRGDLPPGDLPPGDLPPGDLPPGDLPPGDLPPGDLPPGERRLDRRHTGAPVLLDGPFWVYPDQWDTATGWFLFSFPEESRRHYLRLGYLDAHGGFHLSDVIEILYPLR